MKSSDKIYARCYLCTKEVEAKKMYTVEATITTKYTPGETESEKKYILICPECDKWKK